VDDQIAGLNKGKRTSKTTVNTGDGANKGAVGAATGETPADKVGGGAAQNTEIKNTEKSGVKPENTENKTPSNHKKKSY
jgi:hypothetical protein